jgi:hypothetical protein
MAATRISSGRTGKASVALSFRSRQILRFIWRVHMFEQHKLFHRDDIRSRFFSMSPGMSRLRKDETRR